MVLTVECSDQPLDLAFHPINPNLMAAGLVDGTIEVHEVPNNEGENEDYGSDEDSESDTILSTIPVHTMQISSDQRKVPSCRSILFSHDGQNLYTGGSGGDICALDADISCSLGGSETALLWRLPPRSEAVHSLKQLPTSATCGPLLCAGYENGTVRLWDTRLCGSNTSKKACVMTWDEHEDYISGFEHDADGTTLLASSADCSISVMDMRKAVNPQTRSEAIRRSDDQEDEMLSIVLLKNGRKVMCGSQQGVLSVWSWGVWGDVSDRFPGHPCSIDALLKVDEDTVLTGASDGIIRLVQLHPDKLLGVLGEHDGYPVEKLQFNSDRTYVGSVSHDNFIRLWDARVLHDDNDNDDDEEEEEEEVSDEEDQKMPAISTNETSKHESDDDWDDVDDSDSGSDNDGDSEDASESDEEETANDRRSKRLKTENEKFFDDL
ncbi:hypothetical protein MHU86_522 [Fragilaria crotonensis]|nr:hypothetical protein MHU86_522 [Fragilaria crotonensis]